MERGYLTEKQLKRKKLFLRFKIYGSLFLFLGIIFGIVYIFLYSPVFKVKKITFTELNPDSGGDQSISESFKNKLLSDILTVLTGNYDFKALLGKENILIWDIGSTAGSSDIFKFNPELSKLEIKRDYLEREVEFIFEKRDRAGVYCNEIPSGGSGGPMCYWYDKDGIIFSEAPALEGDLIHKIKDYSGRQLGMGEKIMDKKLFLNANKIFDVLEKSGLNIKTLNIENLKLQEAVVKSESWPLIYFSLRNDPSNLIDFLQSIKKLGLQKSEYIDLRVENRVYYK